MIHQQNALIPKTVKTNTQEQLLSFACGDLINDFITQYKTHTGQYFLALTWMPLKTTPGQMVIKVGLQALW